MNRRIRKGVLGTLAVSTTGALALSGCGPSTSTTETTQSATDYSSIEPASEISFWSNHPGNSIDLETAIAEAFEEETGIKVNIVSAGSSYDEVAQKFSTAQVGGDAGDLVVVADVTWFNLKQSGSITAVDDILAAAGADTSTYVESFYSDYLYEGSHYAMPFARSDLVFMYNKDLYEAAGLGDEAPTTWDEVAEYSKAIAEVSPDTIAFAWGSDTSYASWGISSLLWANGADWSDEWDFSEMTSEATISAIQFAQDSVSEGWGKVNSGDPSTTFAAASVAQMINSSGGLKAIQEAASFEVGVAELPSGSAETDDVVPTGGAGVAINANSTPEEQLAAAMFADFLTNSENTVTFSAGTGYLPVRSDADTSSLVEANPLFQVAIDSLDRSRSQSYARVLVPGGPTILDEGLMDILVDMADVETTLASMQEQIEEAYETNVASNE